MPLVFRIHFLRKLAGCRELCSRSSRRKSTYQGSGDPMPYRTYNVSTRTLLQMTAVFIFMFFVCGVGAALAGGTVSQTIEAVPNGVNQPSTTLLFNAAVPPLVVPSTVTSIAGNTHSGAAGYAGDGGLAQGPTPLNPQGPVSQVASPSAIAVDSVGNVYFADRANDIIREINAQTGHINTVAGVIPTGCINGVCSGHTPYSAGSCSNGVPAAGNPVGSGMGGIAVDGYGNIYFSDSVTQTISVVYKAGLRVAKFISLVNPTAAPTPASVVPGNVYFIAGAVSLTGCGGTAGHADAQLSFVNTDTETAPVGLLSGPSFIGLDGAGNIYIDDAGNKSIRVINTQTTAQTFYNTTVQPGYIQAVSLCGISGVTCPVSANTFVANYPQVSNSTWLWEWPGIGQPAISTVFSTLQAFTVDAWGNSYVANQASASPNNAIGVTYAGGPLGHLLNVELETGQEAPVSAGKANANYETAQTVPISGYFYDAYNQMGGTNTTLGNFPDEQAANDTTAFEIRALSMAVDPYGSIWYSDSHYPSIARIDVNSQTVYGIIGSVKQRTSQNSENANLSSPATVGQQAYCDFGIKAGPQTYDIAGDNCPAVMAAIGGGSDLVSDGPGNIYIADTGTTTFTGGTQLIRELLLGTVFPVTAMAVPSTTTTGYTTGGASGGIAGLQVTVAPAPVTQSIQVHFDEWNWPTGMTAGPGLTSKTSPTSNNGFVTTAFSIVPGLVSPEVTLNNTVGSANYGLPNPDFAIDTTDSEFPEWWLMGGVSDSYTGTVAADYFSAGGATCVQPAALQGASRPTPLYSTAGDTDWGVDCIVNVTFTPQAPGLRTAQLMVTTQQMTPPTSVSGVGGGTAATNPTASGVTNTYYIPLTGTGYGSQLAIDGASQTVVPNTGLAATGTNSVAVNSAGVVYATDPTHNRVVIVPSATAGYTGSTTSGSKTVTVSSTAGLGAGLTVTDSLSAIPANTTITAVGTGTITLSAAATSAVTNDTITVAVGPSLTVSSVTSYAQYSISTAATTLSGPLGVAVDAANNIYISDTGNNRILKVNPANTVATLLGNYAWVPGTQVLNQVVSSGTVSRDVTASIAACTTPPCSVVFAPATTTPPAQYAFSAPQGLAVDNNGNVYVADTGNHVVVEIPSNPELGGAFVLLENTGTSTTITNPVSVALDQRGNVYVADTGNVKGNIVLIPAGGGDLEGGNFAGNVSNQINTLQSNFITNGSTVQAVAIGGTGIGSPNGVAVDAAGNVYISDSSDGAVWVAPSPSGFGATPYILNLPGLITPSGLAVDQSGNVYVADSGLGQVLYLNRSAPTVSFGTVPQDLTAPSGVAGVTWTTNGLSNPVCPVLGSSTPCSGVLTVTNIGNAPTLPLSGSATSFPITLTGNTAFAINQNATVSTCLGMAVLAPGASCTVAPTFQPVSDGTQNATLTIAGIPIPMTATTQGTGEQPLVNIVLSTPTLTPAAGSSAVITATVTQLHRPANIAIPTGWIPTGTVTFYWAITSTTRTPTGPQLCGTGGGTGTGPSGPTSGSSLPVTLNASGIATYTLPGVSSGTALAPGLRYVITASYSPADIYDSYTQAPTPLTVNVGTTIPETATAPSSSFAYGAVPPTLSGSAYYVTPTLTTGNSVSWTTTNSAGVVTPLTQCGSSAGVYNIVPIFSGPNACAYGILSAYNSNNTTLATVTETSIPLSSAFVPPAESAFYGAPSINFNSTLQYSGDACGDGASKLSATFSLSNPPTGVVNSQTLSVGTYTVYPTVAGKPIAAGDYSINQQSIGDLALTIVPASTQIGVSAAKPSSVLAGSLSTATYSVNVSTAVPGGIGTPTGSLLVTDTFVPIINGAPGTSATIPACSIYFSGNVTAPFTGSTTQGSPTITQVSTTTGLAFGMTVVGAGIPAGATIAGINKANSTITLSSAATATATNISISSPTVSSMASTFGLSAPYQLTPSTTYETVTGPGIPSGTTLTAVGNGNVTLSNSATATATGVILTATIPNASAGTLSSAGALTPAGANCIQATSQTLLSGSATYTPTNASHGTHYYGFYYGGDSNFNSSVANAATGTGATLAVGGTCFASACLTIDNADFVLSTTTTIITVVPGTTPSGNGLPTAVGQNSAAPGSALITITPLLSETGVINLTCAPQNPTYESCSMTPSYVTLGTTSSACPSASGSCYSVLSISTPAQLPLGFNLNTSKVGSSTTRTVWAFLPFGVLALCIRRRRKLSKALWMLAAIAAVSVGMSGCGSNQVSLYTPVPTGLQSVTVTATGTGITDQTSLTRSYSIGVLIQ
jgi:sugar lactone lactonase YvrE